eukprot:CAMPEP_0171297242 /NCGR_PEP_ID=MMETSP0816-20121228/6040_1 /TAXON_ID=420281 /ORGANISM="Proboscia inermis, Strain CCAP1064/1" /LENGTH=176 /DNA_ID=CAMNT_0011771431 /DNA_START=196 /DNA_END=726 /DNA_ORIENTATION=+
MTSTFTIADATEEILDSAASVVTDIPSAVTDIVPETSLIEKVAEVVTQLPAVAVPVVQPPAVPVVQPPVASAIEAASSGGFDPIALLSNLKIPSLPFPSSAGTSTPTPPSGVDPTDIASKVVLGLINSPIILLVPILTAVAVGSVVAFLIVAYSNPADPDQDEDSYYNDYDGGDPL